MSNSKNKRKRRAWPEKRRQKQAENIRKTKPWTKTTGPKTPEGKAASACNATRHGMRSAEMTELRRLLKIQRLFVKKYQNIFSLYGLPRESGYRSDTQKDPRLGDDAGEKQPQNP